MPHDEKKILNELKSLVFLGSLSLACFFRLLLLGLLLRLSIQTITPRRHPIFFFNIFPLVPIHIVSIFFACFLFSLLFSSRGPSKTSILSRPSTKQKITLFTTTSAQRKLKHFKFAVKQCLSLLQFKCRREDKIIENMFFGANRCLKVFTE